MKRFSSASLMALSFLFAALMLTACTNNSGIGGGECESQSDCPTGLECNTSKGVCECATDDQCVTAFGDDYQCNTFKLCQPRPPCLGNKDCAEDEICNANDPSGGRCIPATSCGSTVHCDFNYYCDRSTETCQPGCQNSGDCQLGSVCINGQCSDGNCSTCPVSPDPDPSYCDYGETCSLSGTCTPHPGQSVLCQSCGTLPGECGGNAICLIDDEVAGGAANYCAPTCRTDLDCPSGYGDCGGVQIVDPNQACTTDAQCGAGKFCLGSSEGQNAYCSCATDADCPADFCLPDFFGGGGSTCAGTGFSCTTDADCGSSCTEVAQTSDGQPIKICETNIGACGKEAGVSCQDLLGDAICNDL